MKVITIKNGIEEIINPEENAVIILFKNDEERLKFGTLILCMPEMEGKRAYAEYNSYVISEEEIENIMMKHIEG